ncbi:TLDc domain-containing protein [Entamoeba marina]
MFSKKDKKKDKSDSKSQNREDSVSEQIEPEETSKSISLLSSRIMRLESEYKHLHSMVDAIKNNIAFNNINNKLSDDQLHNNFYQHYLPLLGDWVGCTTNTVIYDSDVDGMTARSFNDKVCGHENTMTIVQTTLGHVFGCFNSIEIQDPKEHGYGFYMTQDSGFFCFALSTPLVQTPVKLYKKDSFYTAKVYSHDNDKWITGVHCGFYIGIGDSSFVSKKFPLYYYNLSKDDSKQKIEADVDVFSGNHFPETFSVFKVVVLKWSA